MTKHKLRFFLLILAFILLLTGAILQYNDLKTAWIFIVIAIVLYLTARIFMREKKAKE